MPEGRREGERRSWGNTLHPCSGWWGLLHCSAAGAEAAFWGSKVPFLGKRELALLAKGSTVREQLARPG